MNMNTLPLRHELKYFINERQYFVLSGILDAVLSRDPNGDEYNEYHIRSLYFDTVFNNALFDKLNGVFSKAETTKEEVIGIMKDYLPNFEHIETGRSLDGKM